MTEVYDQLNKAWKSTCKILFGEEIGELKEYEEWLQRKYVEKLRVEVSAISGKKTTMICDEYCKGAKFVSFDEIDFRRQFEPLNINEIKDIDSIVEALQERFYYSGNIILGNSRFVEGSTNITDCTYIYNTIMMDYSQYIAYSMYGRRSKFVFGVYGANDCSYLIKGYYTANSQRCFEYHWIRSSSDIFYSANLEGCSDCLFCFNLSGRRRHIGNLEMQKDTYLSLKKKLLSEIADELKRKKSVQSLIELILGLPKKKLEMEVAEPKQIEVRELFDITPIENAFRNTFKILLKKDPHNLRDYEQFLSRKMPELTTLGPDKTASSIDIPLLKSYKTMDEIKHRGISWMEAAFLCKNPRKVDLNDVERLSLHDISALSEIVFVPLDLRFGKNSNVDKAEICINSINCYSGVSFVESKASAFCWWPRESSYVFGSTILLSSSFCIGSHNSTKLTRAFEVDSCTNCSDLYFSHNCDNVHDSIFCFNVKNLKYAIGNAQLQPDQYRKIKDMLVEQMADEILKTKQLRYDIFNIGCGKK